MQYVVLAMLSIVLSNEYQMIPGYDVAIALSEELVL